MRLEGDTGDKYTNALLMEEVDDALPSCTAAAAAAAAWVHEKQITFWNATDNSTSRVHPS